MRSVSCLYPRITMHLVESQFYKEHKRCIINRGEMNPSNLESSQIIRGFDQIFLDLRFQLKFHFHTSMLAPPQRSCWPTPTYHFCVDVQAIQSPCISVSSCSHGRVRKRRPLARASYSQFSSPTLAGCQPHCADSINCGSWYDAQ